jgi:hypothetical protein
MNPNSHKALLELVGELWAIYPHWRLGQLIANVSGWIDQDLWDADDEKMRDGIRLHLEERHHRDEATRAAS